MSHGAHVEAGDGNKRIAILISVLALCLALAETFAKASQTNSIKANIEASNLWSFFQAKTIRQTAIRTAAEQMDVDVTLARDPAVKQRLEGRVAEWKKTAERLQSESKTAPNGEEVGEGRDQLAQRAIVLQGKRDLYEAKYHQYEVASAAFQIAIVLASAYLITNAILLLWGSCALGVIGILFTLIGMFAPKLVHLF